MVLGNYIFIFWVFCLWEISLYIMSELVGCYINEYRCLGSFCCIAYGCGILGVLVSIVMGLMIIVSGSYPIRVLFNCQSRFEDWEGFVLKTFWNMHTASIVGTYHH